MRPVRIVAVFALLAAGCVSRPSPTQTWYAANEAVTAAQTATVDAHTANIIDDETATVLAKMLFRAQAEVDRAETYLPAGGFEFDILIETVREILVEFQVAMLETEP